MNIKVLGSGCVSCKELLKRTEEAIKEIGNNIELEYITDFQQMIAYGMMSAPGLVINEQLVSQGKILKKEEIIQLIKKAK